jgi:hypothetical protein
MDSTLLEILEEMRSMKSTFKADISTMNSTISSIKADMAEVSRDLSGRLDRMESILKSRIDGVVPEVDGNEEHRNIELASVVPQEFEPPRILLLPAPECVRGDNNSVNVFIGPREREVSATSIEKTALLLELERPIQELTSGENSNDAKVLTLRARKQTWLGRSSFYHRGFIRPYDVWCSGGSNSNSDSEDVGHPILPSSTKPWDVWCRGQYRHSINKSSNQI